MWNLGVELWKKYRWRREEIKQSLSRLFNPVFQVNNHMRLLQLNLQHFIFFPHKKTLYIGAGITWCTWTFCILTLILGKLTSSRKFIDGKPIAFSVATLALTKQCSIGWNVVTSTMPVSARQLIPFNTWLLFRSAIFVPMIPYLVPFLSCSSDQFSFDFARVHSKNEVVILPLLSPA